MNNIYQLKVSLYMPISSTCVPINVEFVDIKFQDTSMGVVSRILKNPKQKEAYGSLQTCRTYINICFLGNIDSILMTKKSKYAITTENTLWIILLTNNVPPLNPLVIYTTVSRLKDIGKIQPVIFTYNRKNKHCPFRRQQVNMLDNIHFRRLSPNPM
ncbi:hypothetical protein FF38_00526 [Lucilia cuprina]|uniref:Uncharacterized protein n=1 Tax=Lucilia cuprina TaxID=7375 RepID=A0A0L0CQM8_LUCCU|nr:hypothetical protein FF38_00526 [Lucilia cuprina]